MRTLIFLSLFLIAGAALAQSRTDSQAPSFQAAESVCRMVAEGRAEFLDVPQDYFTAEPQSWASVDIDNDGTTEDLRIVIGGTSHTPGIEIKDEGSGADYVESRYDEAGETFGPWNGALRLLQHDGRVYEVFYREGATQNYPVYVAIHLPRDEDRWLCGFNSAASTPVLAPTVGHEAAAPICQAVTERVSSTQEDFAFTPIEPPRYVPAWRPKSAPKGGSMS
jgi:hypothetical protein